MLSADRGILEISLAASGPSTIFAIPLQAGINNISATEYVFLCFHDKFSYFTEIRIDEGITFVYCLFCYIRRSKYVLSLQDRGACCVVKYRSRLLETIDLFFSVVKTTGNRTHVYQYNRNIVIITAPSTHYIWFGFSRIITLVSALTLLTEIYH
jgi:hypothetical protein